MIDPMPHFHSFKSFTGRSTSTFFLNISLIYMAQIYWCTLIEQCSKHYLQKAFSVLRKFQLPSNQQSFITKHNSPQINNIF